MSYLEELFELALRREAEAQTPEERASAARDRAIAEGMCVLNARDEAGYECRGDPFRNQRPWTEQEKQIVEHAGTDMAEELAERRAAVLE